MGYQILGIGGMDCPGILYMFPHVGPLFLLLLLQCCASVAAAMLLLLLQCCCCADAAMLLQQNPKANGTTKPKHLTPTEAQALA